MKKLLAAATSIVMSASFITSAFASSITVSAAGGVPAVQPNVSMEEAIGGAVNKNADDLTDPSNLPVSDDFIVAGEEYTVKPGDTIDRARFRVEKAGGHYASTLAFEIDPAQIPAGFSLAVKNTTVYAVDHTPSYSATSDVMYNAYTAADGSNDPVPVNEGKACCQFEISVADTVAPGDYEIGLKRFQVVEKAQSPKIEFLATVKPIVIHVEGDVPPTTTTTKANDPVVTTTTKANDPVVTTIAQGGGDLTDPSKLPVYDDFIVAGEEYTVKPGDTIDRARFRVEKAGGHKASTLAFEIDPAQIPAGFTLEVTNTTVYAVDHTPSYSATSNVMYNAYTAEDGTNDPVPVNEGKACCQFEIKVADTVAPGKYEIGLKRFQVVEKAQTPKIEFLATVKPIVINVEGDVPATTTTTKGDDPVVTTTVAPAADGTAEWVIPEVEGTPGENVTMNVYVKGDSTLEVSGASYKVTADGAEFVSVDKNCAAYDSAIVNNAQVNSFAFGQGIGKGTAASDGAVIMTLTYKVPADATEDIPVNWSDVIVSDTNGNRISDKVKTVNGKIIIKAPTTTKPPVADGEARWVIPEVEGTPGENVTMKVYVDGDSTLEVSGASYKVTADGADFVSVDKNCAAYDSAIVNNAQKNSFAFGQGIGKGTAASDGAVIMTLTYKVPADATADIPVKWSDVIVSDTNGNRISDKVVTVDGKIIIKAPTTTTKPPVADGEVRWVIPEVEGTPGENVTMNVYVDGDSTLEVAGASYKVTADGAEFAGVDKNCAAYDSTIINNAQINAFAFGQGIGKGTAASDGAIIMTLTYKVPADATADIPVKWSDVIVSDTNGNRISDKVVTVDGKIIIKAPTTTKPPVADGEVRWVIPEVEGTPGENVTMSVYVDGDSTLQVAGASYKVTAAGAEFAGVDKNCAAYDSTIINNAQINAFAFGQGIGKGTAASDGAVIMTLTYKVPADATEDIPVNWSDVIVSDTNGNRISDKVVTVDGKIIIKAPTTTTKPPVADGEVRWVIPEVEGTPGENVTMKVYVDGDSTLEVAGASYKVTADGADFVSVDKNCAAYDSSIVNNAEKNSFAFGQGIGKGTAASDGAIIMTLTYKVPADATEDIPVNWSDVIVSDTNGNRISDKVVTVNGKIIIKRVTTTVTVPVTTVTDPATTVTDPVTTATAPITTVTDPVTTVTDPVTTVTDPVTTVTDPATTVTDPVTTVTDPVTTVTDPATTVTDPVTTVTDPVTTVTDPVTTATAPVTTVTDPVTTAPPVADGEVRWVIPEVEGTPGENVTMVVYVDGDSTLKVAGASYKVIADGAEFVSVGKNCEAYNSTIINNAQINAFAFGQGTGKGSPASNGAVIMTLTYKVPADATADIPVKWSDVIVSDENGNRINDKVITVDGKIIIKAPVTTVTDPVTTETKPVTTVTDPVTTVTDPATTVTDPVTTVTDPVTTVTDPATTATAPVTTVTDPVTTVTDPVTTVTDPVTTVTDPATTVTDPVTTVTDPVTTVTDPATTVTDPVTTATAPVTTVTDPVTTATPVTGKVQWVIPEVEAAPGDTVTMKIYVNGTSDVEVSGASFKVNVDPSVEFIGVNEKSAAYGDATIISNAAINGFAFAQGTGKSSVAADKAIIMEITYKVPDNATADIPVTWADLIVSDVNGNRITDKVETVDGKIIIKAPVTTVTDPVTTVTDPDVTTVTDPDITTVTSTSTGGPSSALPGSATTTTHTAPLLPGDVVAKVEVVDGFYFSHDPRPFKGEQVKADQVAIKGELVPFDVSKVSLVYTGNGGKTPEEAYGESGRSDFTYELDVYYDGILLYDETTNSPVRATAYIGVKGDATLDGLADGDDASAALTYYSKISTGGLASNTLVNIYATGKLEELAAFLVDTDKDVYSPGNWKVTKADRLIDGDDASSVLTFYSKVSTGSEIHTAWNEVLASTERGLKFENYKANGTEAE